jgi:hypothetical protein
MICAFFLLIGAATSTRQHVWEVRLESVDWDIQQLETRRNSLIQAVDELERRGKELENRISEQENTKGDENDNDTDS